MCAAIFPQVLTLPSDNAKKTRPHGETWRLLCQQREALLNNHPTFSLCFQFSNFKRKGVWSKTTLFLWISPHGGLLFNTTLQQLKNNFSYAAHTPHQEQKHEIIYLWVVFFWVLATGFGWTNIFFSLADISWTQIEKTRVRHWLRTPDMALLLLPCHTQSLGRRVLLIPPFGQLV